MCEVDLDLVNEEIDGLIDELKVIKVELGDDNLEFGDGEGDDGIVKFDNIDDESKEDCEKDMNGNNDDKNEENCGGMIS